MKRWIWTLALVLLAGPLYAGGGIGVYASSWDTDEADNDLGGGILVKFGMGEALAAEVRGTFYSSLVVGTGAGPAELEAQTVDLGLAYNFATSGKVTPYLGGGGTYYMLSLDDGRLGGIEDEAGWYAVGGLDIKVGRSAGVFLEALYRDAEATISGSDLGFQVVDVPFDMGGVAGNFGVMLRW